MISAMGLIQSAGTSLSRLENQMGGVLQAQPRLNCPLVGPACRASKPDLTATHRVLAKQLTGGAGVRPQVLAGAARS